jgi:uncharacterized protein YndB with AHSA1/START domain
MQIAIWILIVLVALTVVLWIYASSRPDHFRIERSTTIQSSPEKIFALINNFHQWEAWSPWEKVDPQISRTYSGSSEGVGAIYAWSGNKEIGRGRMEIIESNSPTKIAIQLDFFAPFEAHNTAEFVLTPQGDSTQVTHAMFGPSPLLSKLMGLVFNMDKMVGDKFEEGLKNLKQLAQAANASDGVQAEPSANATHFQSPTPN